MIEAEQPPPDICCLLPQSNLQIHSHTTNSNELNQHQSTKHKRHQLQPRPSHRLFNFTLLTSAFLSFCCLSVSNASVLPNPKAAVAAQSTVTNDNHLDNLRHDSIEKKNVYDQSSTLEFIPSSLDYLSNSIFKDPSSLNTAVGDYNQEGSNDIISSSSLGSNQNESQRLEQLIYQLSRRRDQLNSHHHDVGRHSKRSLDLVPAPTSHLGPVMKLFRHFKPKMVHSQDLHQLRKRESLTTGEKIGYGFLIPILVLLSGVFAGLTIGYMSLDDTQLQVLMAQGTPEQKKKAEKIIMVRQDPHRLLTTLLIANMCTNETLPIIAEPAFGGGVPAVLGSIVMVIVFAELIPQSVCARFGLEVGAYMAWPTRITMWIFWPVAYPVSRVLHWTLGAHQGIIYRRGELKELVTMHAASGGRGGDLQKDTVMLVGGALDLQEKVVKEAMTPIEKVFMLPFEAKLDYPTLEKIVRSGHSRIPVYHEIEVPVSTGGLKSGSETPSKRGILGAFTRRASGKQQSQSQFDKSSSNPSLPDGVEVSKANSNGNGFSSSEDEKASLAINQAGVSASNIPGIEMVKKKKILGTLLVKSCVLLDPEDAVPVSALTLNALPTVPGDEPLLNVLNVFQEGRSHMAIVSPRPRSVGLSRSTADVGSKGNLNLLPPQRTGTLNAAKAVDGLGHITEEKTTGTGNGDQFDLERASSGSDSEGTKRGSIWRRFKRDDKSQNEEIVTDTTSVNQINTDNTEEEAPGYYDEGLPIGIITMEDVLEELLQEEIYDEYDKEGEHANAFSSLSPPPSPQEKINVKAQNEVNNETGLDQVNEVDGNNDLGGEKKTVLQRLGIARKPSNRNSSSTSTDVVSTEPEEMKEIPSSNNHDASGLSNSIVGLDGSSQAEDYLNSRDVSSSVSPMGSRPPTPSQQPNVVTFESFANGNNGGGGINPLASPSLGSNRPVIVRKQAPGGQTSTSVVSEGYLRGRRPLIQGLGLNDGSSGSSGADTPPMVRSLTPSQSRGNRFKSTPITGAASGSVTPGIKIEGNSNLNVVTTGNNGRGKDQALEAQAAAAGSSNAPINLEESQASLNETGSKE